jgi:GTP-binding protein
VVADIPGIIEGAHQGKGLGDRFLQHVERTRVLAYLIPIDSPDPQATYQLLRAEAMAYSPELGKKQHVVVLTKTDLLPEGETVPTIEVPEALGVVSISAVANRGLSDMKEFFWRLVSESSGSPSEESVPLP